MAADKLRADAVPSSALNAPDLYRLTRMGETKKGLKAAAQEFESLFLNQLLQSMRKTVQKCERFHGGRAEEVFEGMFDQELSRELAKAGGIGLAKILYGQLEHLVEAQKPSPDQSVTEMR